MSTGPHPNTSAPPFSSSTPAPELEVALRRSSLRPLAQWGMVWFVVSIMPALGVGVPLTIGLRHLLQWTGQDGSLLNALPVFAVWGLLLGLWRRVVAGPATLTITGRQVRIATPAGRVVFAAALEDLRLVPESISAGRRVPLSYAAVALHSGGSVVRLHASQSTPGRGGEARSADHPDFELAADDLQELTARLAGGTAAPASAG